jgi:hypothetical protein
MSTDPNHRAAWKTHPHGTRCAAHNGTYTCERPQGHEGQHEQPTPVRDAESGRVTHWRIARWADAYGPMTFLRRVR